MRTTVCNLFFFSVRARRATTKQFQSSCGMDGKKDHASTSAGNQSQAGQSEQSTSMIQRPSLWQRRGRKALKPIYSPTTMVFLCLLVCDRRRRMRACAPASQTSANACMLCRFPLHYLLTAAWISESRQSRASPRRPTGEWGRLSLSGSPTQHCVATLAGQHPRRHTF